MPNTALLDSQVEPLKRFHAAKWRSRPASGYPARHSRGDCAADANDDGAATRIRDRRTDRTGCREFHSNESGHAVPSPGSPGTERLDQRRLAENGEQPRGKLLRDHAIGNAGACQTVGMVAAVGGPCQSAPHERGGRFCFRRSGSMALSRARCLRDGGRSRFDWRWAPRIAMPSGRLCGRVPRSSASARGSAFRVR
jgi:hypothetical protein